MVPLQKQRCHFDDILATAAPEVVKMTTSGSASVENSTKWWHFCFTVGPETHCLPSGCANSHSSDRPTPAVPTLTEAIVTLFEETASRVLLSKLYPRPSCNCKIWVNFQIYSWWRHEMEIFSALLALCTGNSPVTVNSPHKGQWRGALMFSLICVLNTQLSKQSWGWWFETQSRLLWRHCNAWRRRYLFCTYPLKNWLCICNC